MKVIIKKTGQIKEVADGYAQNHLLPHGLAEPATKEAVQRIQKEHAHSAAAIAASESEWNALAEICKNLVVSITASANEKGALFGAVKESAILEALERAGHPMEKKWLQLTDPIKHIGDHSVHVVFPNNTKAVFTLQIIAE